MRTGPSRTLRPGALFGRRRSLLVKDLVLGFMALLLIGAAYTSTLIIERQAALSRVSRYNLTWLVSQAGLEVSRLCGTVAESLVPGSQVDADEVDLRLSIVENRIQLLQSGEVANFIATSPELGSIVDGFRRTVSEARHELDGPPDPAHPRRLMDLLAPLNIPIARLTAAANAYSSNMEARDRHDLNSLHWLFAAILAAITTCGLGLVAAMTWHNRLLARAQDEAMRQNLVLHQRDGELRQRNQQFDAALNNMSQALCMMDAEGRLRVCNVRFAELFGLPSADSMAGRTAEEIFQTRPAANPFHAMMSTRVAERQAEYARDSVSVTFVEQDEAGRALAVSQEPMDGGGWVSTFEDITERRQTEARISYLAHHDALTGLPNRVWFHGRLEEAVARHAARGESLAVLCLDLDRFKQVNDMYGHPAGDRLLCLVGARLQGCIRQSDVLARLGGDEFAVLQSGAGQPGAAQATAARIIRELERPYDIEGHHVVIGASVGVVLADEEEPVSAVSLLNSADIALYRAKSDGRGLFRCYEAAMGQEVRERRQMETDLRNALDQEELAMHYQPLYDIASDRVCGFEALLRWQHPQKGNVPPATFIPIAEEVGLIVPIGEWALRQACADAASWPGNLKVAVNLSPVQFRSPGLVEMVARALVQSGLAASRLELEVTESTLLQDSDAVRETLGQLRALGARLVLDDFGTGYSSLSYLHSFPFSKVKIDRSFVSGIEERPDCEAIVRAVTVLAATLNMTTTAEGVETAEQLERLRALNCTEVQGYFFDRPRPIGEIARWLPANIVHLRRPPLRISAAS